ncbi:pyruvate dehydrogenase (acetyl-transferring) kinase, mitochondrial [Tanacetum coccineum]
MKEINNFQQDPDEKLYQAWERFKELLMKCPRHYLTKMQEVVLFYNGLDVPTRQILNSRGAIPSKTAAEAKVAIQEMAEYSQKWHNGTSRTRSTKTSDGLAAIQAQLNNRGREIKKVNEKFYAAQVGCEQCKGPHYTKDCPLKEEDKTLEETYYTQFGAPFQGGGYRATTSGELAKRHEENSNLIKEIRASMDAAIRNQGASIKTLEIQIRYARGYKVPLILKRTFLSTTRDKIDVYKRNITLRVGEERIIFKSVKPASSLIKRFYILSLRERMELDLEARLMRETLVLNRSLDPLNRDYIELNNLNVPIELRRDQVDDLMPTIEEDEVVKEFRARNDARMVSEIFGYPSDYDHDKKIRIDYAYNLKFSCMIVKTDFAVLEDMDDYRDEGMGDVIFGELFLREVIIKARRFNGMITIYNGNDEVTYEMVRSHPRFKHHTNIQCNKIPPLLKVSNEDKKNRISYPYQKLKRFYKGVLNLGLDFI